MTIYRVTIENSRTSKRFARVFRAPNEAAAMLAAYSMLRTESEDYFVVSIVAA